MELPNVYTTPINVNLINWDDIHQRCQSQYFLDDGNSSIIEIYWDSGRNCPIIHREQNTYLRVQANNANGTLITYADCFRALNMNGCSYILTWPTLNYIIDNVLDTPVATGVVCQMDIYSQGAGLGHPPGAEPNPLLAQ
jgi:hypothetical protein